MTLGTQCNLCFMAILSRNDVIHTYWSCNLTSGCDFFFPTADVSKTCSCSTEMTPFWESSHSVPQFWRRKKKYHGQNTWDQPITFGCGVLPSERKWDPSQEVVDLHTERWFSSSHTGMELCASWCWSLLFALRVQAIKAHSFFFLLRTHSLKGSGSVGEADRSSWPCACINISWWLSLSHFKDAVPHVRPCPGKAFNILHR